MVNEKTKSIFILVLVSVLIFVIILFVGRRLNSSRQEIIEEYQREIDFYRAESRTFRKELQEHTRRVHELSETGRVEARAIGELAREASTSLQEVIEASNSTDSRTIDWCRNIVGSSDSVSNVL